MAGYRVRAKENRYFALWRILEKTSRITVGELVQSTHFTAEEIKEGIRTINSTGRAIFSLEPHSGEIVNSGMNHTAAQESVECPNCGARNEESVFLGTTTAKCEYCGEMFQRSAEASSPPTPHRYVRRSNRGRAIRRTLNSTWVYL